MNPVLIIESDCGRAALLRGVCRDLGLSTRHSSDALNGLLIAAEEAPCMILIDEADDRVGAISISRELRRYDSRCWIPVVVVGEGPALRSSQVMIARGVDGVVADICSDDFEDRMRKALSRWVGLPRTGAACRPRRTFTVGEMFCEGNLFRNRATGGDLFELSITEESLWLHPVTCEASTVRFDDPIALIDRFDFVPWA
jgi:CheY-like chemotaxis protein